MGKIVKAIVGVGMAIVGAVTGNWQLIVSGVAMALQSVISPSGSGKMRAAAAATILIGEVPRQAIVGRACTPGSLVDACNYGGTHGTDWELLVIALADHKCDALEGFYVGDTYVPFVADGDVAGYNGQLKVWWRNGTETQAIPSVVTTNAPGWTANDNGAGVAYVAVAYKADAEGAKNPVWPNGRPTFSWVVRGALCYQARKDSSVGGVGTHRRDNPATWEWTDNLIDCRYNWVRGFYACDRVTQPAQLLVGRGLSAVEAPPANVFHRANLCDEMVDGVKRYTASGVIEATEAFIDVENDFAAACAGIIVQPEGSVEIDPGEAKAASFHFTDRDLVVGAKVKRKWRRGVGDREWVNTVVADYIEPAFKWAKHAAPVRRDVADIIADGMTREEKLSLGFCTNAKQAGRVAEIKRRLGRLQLTGSVTLPPRFSEIEEGDWGTWQSDRYLDGATMTVRVEGWSSGKDWQHSIGFRQISASCFSDTAALTDGAVAIDQAAPAPLGAPAPGSWALAAGHLSAGGLRTPALIVTGATTDPAARFVRVEYILGAGAPAPGAVWSDAGITGPDIQRREIAVAPGGIYRVAISYVVDGRQGDRLILGPVTAGDITYPDGTPVDDLQPADPGATEGAIVGGPDGNVLDSRGAAWIGANGATSAGNMIMNAELRLNDAGMIYTGTSPGVIVPTDFWPSTTYGSYTGQTGSGAGLRDGAFVGAASVWASAGGDSTPRLAMRLPAVQFVDQVRIAPISSSFDSWGPSWTNGRILDISSDSTNAVDGTWTTIATLSGHADGVKTSYSIGANCRWVRVRHTSTWIGIGEFEALDAGGSPSCARVSSSTGDPGPAFLLFTGPGVATFNEGIKLPAAMASRFFMAALGWKAMGVAGGATQKLRVRWWKQDGVTSAGVSELETMPATAGAWAPFDTAVDRPADAASFSIEVERTGTGGNSKIMLPYLGTSQPSADITTLNAPRHEGPLSDTFYASSAGVLTAGQLPRNYQFKRFRGLTDVSATGTTWTIVSQTGITGGTVTVSNGVITIPTGVTIGLTASIVVKSTRSGEPDIESEIKITRVDAAAPSSGGGGGGAINDTTLGSITGTSWTAISDIMPCKTGSSGTLTYNASVDFFTDGASPSGSFDVELRWRRRPVGGSFSDVAPGAYASVGPAIVDFEPPFYYTYPSSAYAAPTETGLPTLTDYELVLEARRTSAALAKTIYFTGIAGVTGG